MTKITKEQISKMNELRKSGMSYNSISLTLLIPLKTVMYYLSEKTRNRIKEYQKEFAKKTSKKNKLKKKAYMREYMKRRYQNNQTIRQNQINRVKEYNKRKNE
jgi:orotate phosphoribosyltransferase-like protein